MCFLIHYYYGLLIRLLILCSENDLYIANMYRMSSCKMIQLNIYKIIKIFCIKSKHCLSVVFSMLHIFLQGCTFIRSRIFMHTCSTILVFSAWKNKYTERCCNFLDRALATFSLNVFQWSSKTYFWLSCMVEIGWYSIRI